MKSNCRPCTALMQLIESRMSPQWNSIRSLPDSIAAGFGMMSNPTQVALGNTSDHASNEEPSARTKCHSDDGPQHRHGAASDTGVSGPLPDILEEKMKLFHCWTLSFGQLPRNPAILITRLDELRRLTVARVAARYVVSLPS